MDAVHTRPRVSRVGRLTSNLSKTPPPRRSVRHKLVRLVLIMTAISVSLAGIAMLTDDLSVYRSSWAKDLSNEAAILAISTAPALAFDDHQVAERNLSAMRLRSRVSIAALYRADGRLYAAYSRDPHATAPSRAPPLGERSSGERVELSQPVTHDGEMLGTIYLLARYDLIARVKAYLGIFSLLMAASLAVAYVLAERFQRSITAPLEAMAKVARGIVEQRDYSQRATIASDDEIGTVVLAFNNMLHEVEARARASAQANTALESANRALQDEIKVRQAAEAALKEADRRKDEFLATLAHELRNPLAPIRHAVRLLDNNAADARQQEWGREVIGRQVQRMALLLDDLLDVSRITRGRLELKVETVDLGSVVDAALEVGRPLIDAKAQKLTMLVPDPRLRIAVDPLRLSQALSNLITNAAKYTDEKGEVTLRVELSASELIFSVKDTGIGIEPHTIPRLFELFTQLDAAINRAEGGLGIGLALVKGLVELHGGTVEAKSQGAGLGSEFIIRLPRALVDVGRSISPPADTPAKAEPVRCKVLMADDNRDAVDSMAMVLGISGYEVCVAYNGKQAFELAQQHRPDVTILDIGMPDMSGHEIATAIRRQPWGRAMRLIAVTGWGQNDDIEAARASGFDLHLTKPVDFDRLEAVLADYVRRREPA